MSDPLFNLFKAISADDLNGVNAAISAGASGNHSLPESFGETIEFLKTGISALGAACLLNNHCLAEALLKSGADVNLKMAVSGTTALDYVAANNPESLESIKVLIDYGANLEDADFSGSTILSRLCDLNNSIFYPVIALLIKAGANINSQDTNGFTPLMKCIDGHDDIAQIKFLIDSGADPTIRNYIGDDALEVARRNRNWAAELMIMNFLDNEALSGVIRADNGCEPQALCF